MYLVQLVDMTKAVQYLQQLLIFVALKSDIRFEPLNIVSYDV